MKKLVKALSLALAIFAVFLGGLFFFNDNVHTYLKAHSGDVPAEIELGTFYYNEGDLPAAVEWYQKAANQFNSDAQYNLGVIYQTGGEGIPKDEKAASIWYEKAAQQGHLLAQYNFGLMYAKGQYVPQNLSLAFSWFEQAAMHGLKEAQIIAGEMYVSGEQGSKNLVEAYKWFSIANASDHLARLENQMSQDEISKAKKLASEWKVAK